MTLDRSGPREDEELAPDIDYGADAEGDEPLAFEPDNRAAVVAVVYWVLSSWRPTFRLVLIVLAVGVAATAAGMVWQLVAGR